MDYQTIYVVSITDTHDFTATEVVAFVDKDDAEIYMAERINDHNDNFVELHTLGLIPKGKA